MRDYVNSTALQEYTTKLVAKLKTLFPGTPTAAATVADMTDHSKTYVYVGSETGYTAGDWYYWDGSAWTSGGPFQATSIITDTTLAVAGEAADAKATGDAIAAAKTAVLNAMAPAYNPSATYAVDAYVNHNGAIYRCTTAITTAEAWTAGHWTEVPLGTDLASQVSELKTQINNVTPEMTTFAEGGGIDPDGNLIYPDDLINNKFVNNLNGAYSNTTYNYCATPQVEIEPGKNYTFYFPADSSQLLPYSYAFYDENKSPIENAYGRVYAQAYVTAPLTAKYLAYCFSGTKNDNLYPVMIKGSSRLTEEYVAPTISPITIPDSDYVTKEYVDSRTTINVTLELPESYELVVDDIFELFWKGVIKAVDYENYFVEVICDVGRNYKRKFFYRPVAGEVGNHSMQVNLYNSNLEKIDTATITLAVKAKATSPISKKVVLYVTDSLGMNGYVPDEFNRRLVGSGGTPAGDGLSNITFIGNSESVSRNIKYVGNGGWTWSSYNASMSTNAYMWITANAHGKTINDQHSVYKDSNNTEWKLETIETNRIKIIRVSGSTALPSTGTLTWVSGGENHADIVYTASEQAAGNPFWSETQNKISFSEFVQSQNESTLDYVYVLLGWNSTGTTEENLKSYVRTFINNVLSDYPNCKIVILGIEVPAQDGLGYNYGQNIGTLSSYKKTLQFVFTLNKWYEEITQEQAYTGKVTYVNVSGQFDTEYNMPTTTTQVNTRNNTTVTMQSNGIHPAESGYYQIADACYRDFVHKLQG